MSLILKCTICPNDLPEGSYLSKKFCDTCYNKRRVESQNKKNRGRAAKREFERIKVNLFKSWVMWGERN